MYDDVLFPTDGGPGAEVGFERALAVAETFDARVHVLYVADTTRDSVTVLGGRVVDALQREGEAVVEGFVDRAEARGVDVVDVVLQGRPDEAIVAYAADHADLVVMPTRGREGVTDRLIGSTTERVVRRSSVPVLTVPVSAE